MNRNIERDDFESGEYIRFESEFKLCRIVESDEEIDGLCAWEEEDGFVIVNMDQWSWIDIRKGEGIKIDV